MFKRLAIAALAAASVVVSAYAATPPVGSVSPESAAAPPTAPEAVDLTVGRAVSRGGMLRLRWNDDLLLTMGLERRVIGGAKATHTTDEFALTKDSEFELNGSRNVLTGMAGGSGGFKGGFDFAFGEHAVRWENPKMLVRPGIEPRIDLVTGKGEVLFYIDTLMHKFEQGGNTYRIRSADIRIAPEFAERLGRLDAANWAVGEVKLLAPVESRIGGAEPKAAGDPNWPGEQVVGQPTGTVYRADVFMSAITPQLMRCGTCSFNADGSLNSCTSVAGCTTSTHLVYAPSSTLRNNVNNGTFNATVNNDGKDGNCPTPADPATCIGVSPSLYTADVPWWEKFTSSPNDPDFNYPYMFNDVHPNLIWNLYRFDTVGTDARGRITQIGRSGVKHAFLTTNSGAGCDSSNGNQVLGRSCSDTYGTGNNDASDDLGPRSEIVPASGLFGRCGSIFDPGCAGSQTTGGAASLFHQRMLAPTNRVTAAGGTFMFESWYIIRDDINIYNTMATRTLSFNATTLAPTGLGAFNLGSAIDKWVPRGTSSANMRNTEVSSAEGHFQVAMKVHDLGGGLFQYEYAVMNHDFARAETTGIESNHTLRVLSNNGFKRFAVPHLAGANISQIQFDDGDNHAGNDWAGTDTGTAVQWLAPSDAASLNWGAMSRFSFVADRAPGPGATTLEVTRTGSPATFSVDSLVAGSEVLFSNSFE